MSDGIAVALAALRTAAAGAALAGAAGAVTVRWLGRRHVRHVRWGRLYLASMTILGLAWLAGAAAEAALAPALVAVLILYPSWSGFRHARRGDRDLPPLDRASALAMTLFAIGLLGYGIRMIVVAGSLGAGLTLFGFGMIALVLGGLDVRAFGSDEARGRSRIVNHLGMMLAGSFAAAISLLAPLLPTQLVLIAGAALLFLAVHLVVYWSGRVLTQGIPPTDD